MLSNSNKLKFNFQFANYDNRLNDIINDNFNISLDNTEESSYLKLMKSLKEKIKHVFLKSEDKILQKYEKLFFVINDLSHQNNWEYHLLEILSFSNEIDELCK